jgi:hypothetical protein
LFDLVKRVKTEVEQSLKDSAREVALTAQIADRVWNDKLTRAPWFKHANEIVSEFQKRLAKADQDLAKNERDSNTRLD